MTITMSCSSSISPNAPSSSSSTSHSRWRQIRPWNPPSQIKSQPQSHQNSSSTPYSTSCAYPFPSPPTTSPIPNLKLQVIEVGPSAVALALYAPASFTSPSLSHSRSRANSSTGGGNGQSLSRERFFERDGDYGIENDTFNLGLPFVSGAFVDHQQHRMSLPGPHNNHPHHQHQPLSRNDARSSSSFPTSLTSAPMSPSNSNIGPLISVFLNGSSWPFVTHATSEDLSEPDFLSDEGLFPNSDFFSRNHHQNPQQQHRRDSVSGSSGFPTDSTVTIIVVANLEPGREYDLEVGVQQPPSAPSSSMDGTSSNADEARRTQGWAMNVETTTIPAPSKTGGHADGGVGGGGGTGGRKTSKKKKRRSNSGAIAQQSANQNSVTTTIGSSSSISLPRASPSPIPDHQSQFASATPSTPEIYEEDAGGPPPPYSAVPEDNEPHRNILVESSHNSHSAGRSLPTPSPSPSPSLDSSPLPTSSSALSNPSSIAFLPQQFQEYQISLPLPPGFDPNSLSTTSPTQLRSVIRNLRKSHSAQLNALKGNLNTLGKSLEKAGKDDMRLRQRIAGLDGEIERLERRRVERMGAGNGTQNRNENGEANEKPGKKSREKTRGRRTKSGGEIGWAYDGGDEGDGNDGSDDGAGWESEWEKKEKEWKALEKELEKLAEELERKKKKEGWAMSEGNEALEYETIESSNEMIDELSKELDELEQELRTFKRGGSIEGALGEEIAKDASTSPPNTFSGLKTSAFQFPPSEDDTEKSCSTDPPTTPSQATIGAAFQRRGGLQPTSREGFFSKFRPAAAGGSGKGL